MQQKNFKQDFHLGEGSYLLSHSVGRPLKSANAVLGQSFFAAWEKSEPWGDWLGIIDDFRKSLSQLFNAPMAEFCPQVNLSSAVTKIVMSLKVLEQKNAKVLMSEIDFPSIGFALQKALPQTCELIFIPKDLDVTDAQVWSEYLKSDVTLAFVSHAFSNTGQLAPIADIFKIAQDRNILTILDMAQSAGIVPLDLQKTTPSFMVGSCVKWLCGGPGAAYLWVHPDHIGNCQPKDVGWFSHENPFEFDIHNFRYQTTSLKFWGGTPSVVPYAIAAQSICYFAEIGSPVLRAHNQKLMSRIAEEFAAENRSPKDPAKRNGTIILDFGNANAAIISALRQQQISVDSRRLGLRISPHIYNDAEDVERLIGVIRQCWKS